jgi:hypothetical protein
MEPCQWFVTGARRVLGLIRDKRFRFLNLTPKWNLPRTNQKEHDRLSPSILIPKIKLFQAFLGFL